MSEVDATVLAELEHDITDEYLRGLFLAGPENAKRDGSGVKARDREDETGVGSGLISDGRHEYSYDAMLERAFDEARAHNPALLDRSIKKIKPPRLARIGTTRTGWTNFAVIATSLARDPVHMKDFILSELNTNGSITTDGALTMKGRLMPKKIESLVRKYIQEYCMCNNCLSLSTSLTKDPVTRLHFLACTSCGATRSVAPIRSGFSAVRRGERRKARTTT